MSTVLIAIRTGEYLFLNIPIGDPQCSWDSWFKFERGSGQLSKYFRIITPSNGYALVSRTHVEPHYINNPSSELYPDQHFNFLYEDMQIDSVHYDVESGEILPSKPLVLTSQKVTNDTSSVQETTVSVNQKTTHTSSFEYSLGFKIAAETEFEGTSNNS